MAPTVGVAAVNTNNDLAETEINNTTLTANSSGLSGAGSVTALGAISIVSDVDFFSFTVPAAQTLNFTATTYVTFAGRACTGSPAVELILHDAIGAVLAEGTAPACESIGSTILGAGTYYVSVREEGTNATIPSYFLDLTLTP